MQSVQFFFLILTIYSFKSFIISLLFFVLLFLKSVKRTCSIDKSLIASMYARKKDRMKQTYKAAKSPLCHWYKSFFSFFFQFSVRFFCFSFLVYRYLFCTFAHTSCEFFFLSWKIHPWTTAFLFNAFHYEAKLICKKKWENQKEKFSFFFVLLGKWRKELCEQIFFSLECIAICFDFTLWQQMWSGFSHFRV